jgi:DNA-binding NarL/FixJ family response regulator
VFERHHSDIVIAGEAETGEELFGLLADTQADVILLDIILPDMSGIEVARRLRRDYPAVKILAISAENTAETVRALLEIGIDGFISKRMGKADELPEAIRTVMDGIEYYGRDISAIMYDIFVAKRNTADPTPEFSDREREIILLCRDGLTCKQIAHRLFISPRTVDTHKTNIFRKLGINSTVEMIQYALKKGIIRIEN